jgi:hypothetical protein
LKAQIGLWVKVEAVVLDILDDAGTDGEGGRWAVLRIDYAKRDGVKLGYPHAVFQVPRPVELYFMGPDAKVARALSVGDRIQGQGRIHGVPRLGGALTLLPAELIAYPRGST